MDPDDLRRDDRLLEDIHFGTDKEDASEVAAITKEMRELFAGLGCKTGEDISKVGCTTLFSAGISVEEINKIRLKMAGSGIGLCCFVHPGLYCLGHDTIGGLQEGQEAPPNPGGYGDLVRPLTEKEAAIYQITDRARRTRGDEAAKELLTGKDPETLAEMFSGEEPEDEVQPAPATGGPSSVRVQVNCPCGRQHTFNFNGG